MPQKTCKNITSRELCLEVIINVLEKGEFSKEILHAALKNEEIDARERAFITNIAEGTIERKIELDYIIGLYSKVRVEKLKPYIRNILRMSIYQIIYMDKVPDNAAVNEAVKITVKKGYSGLRGYVNGVLRNIVRTYKDITYPDKAKDVIRYYSVKYSMPEWLVKHYLSELSQEDMDICMDYFLSKSDLTVRAVDIDNAKVLRDRFAEAGYETESGSIFSYAYRIKNSGKVENLPGYNDGEFVVQDESSMLPAHVVYSYYKNNMAKENKINILDMCAAPGGKTMHLVSLFKDNASYEARDVSDKKVEKIKENLDRAKYTNVNIKVADALVKYEENKDKYDIIVADLPCSGLGVIAKKSDIKYNIKEDDLASLSEIQASMLDNAAYYTKKDGIIVYSTCTVNKKENEDNCSSFLNRHADFEKVNIADYIPEHMVQSVTPGGELAVVPGRYGSDGFFVAIFKKKQ